MRDLIWCGVMVVSACGDEVVPLELLPCSLGESAGVSVDIEAISPDGAVFAYSSRDEDWRRSLHVIAATCEAPAELVTISDVFPDTPARFCGSTLLAFVGGNEDLAMALVAWRPGDDEPTIIATNVDPGATRCASDGEHFTTEADDVRGDGLATVTLLVVETQLLTSRTVAVLDRARARFTHDARRLVYSGAEVLGYEYDAVFVEDVEGGEPVRFTNAVPGRWELSHDDALLVYSPRAGVLARHPVGEGADVVLARNLREVAGKELDVSEDDRVAYLSIDGGLRIMPLAGGDAIPLGDPPVSRILEHRARYLAYERSDGLHVVAPGGGTPIALGLGAQIVDEHEDALLVLVRGRLMLVDLDTWRTRQLGESVWDGAFTADGRIVVGSWETGLALVNRDGGGGVLRAASSGTFALSPGGTLITIDFGDPAPITRFALDLP